MDKKIVSIYISDKIHRKIKIAAAKQGFSMGDIIEFAILDYLKKEVK